MTIYFAPIARLLGDLIVSLPPLQRLIATNEDVRLILRSPAQFGIAERIPGLRGVIIEPDYLRLPLEERANTFNLRDHRLQRDHVWGSPEFYRHYPGFCISDVIAQICHDFGLADGQNKLWPLNYNRRPECEGKIVFVPGTAAPIKTWPNAHWLALRKQLNEAGKEVIMIGEPRVNTQIAQLMQTGMPWCPTRTISDALDAVSSAQGVVAVDTGLMHLAVHQGVKTVALFRDYTMFARNYSHAENIVAADCSTQCKAGEFDFSPNMQTFFNDWNSDKIFEFWNNMKCKQEQGCMSRISVEVVLEAVMRSGM